MLTIIYRCVLPELGYLPVGTEQWTAGLGAVSAG